MEFYFHIRAGVTLLCDILGFRGSCNSLICFPFFLFFIGIVIYLCGSYYFLGILRNLVCSCDVPEWLLNLEDKGLRVFGNGMSKFRTKLVFDNSSVDYEHLIFKPDRTNTDDDIFFIDKEGQQTEKIMEEDQPMQSMDAVFISAAQSMKFTSNDARRKRKERRGEGEKQVKFQRYKLNDSFTKENPVLSSANDMSSGSEVENPPSDDDVEEMEQ